MSADAHAAFERQSRRALHRGLVARMPAAGDVRRGDVLHQRGLVRRVLEFAHVAVEIDASYVASSDAASGSAKTATAPARAAAPAPAPMVTASNAHLVARAQLAEPPEIRGDHVGRFRVAAGRLMLHEEDDRLAVGRDLHRAQRRSFRQHAAGRARNRRAAQAQAHAVGFFADRVPGFIQLAGEAVRPAGLRSRGSRRRSETAARIPCRGRRTAASPISSTSPRAQRASADSRHHVHRSAAHHERNRQPAAKRQVRSARPSVSRRSAPSGPRAISIGVHSGRSAPKSDAGDRDRRGAFELEHAAGQRHLQRRRVLRVPHEQVGRPQRHRIRRARGRDAVVRPAESAQILDRRLQPRRDHADAVHTAPRKRT